MYAKARALGLTHIVDEHGEADPKPATFTHALVSLGNQGCLERVAAFQVQRYLSLTLRTAKLEPVNKVI